MATATTKAPSRTVHRQRALDPWLEQLRQRVDEHAAGPVSGGPLEIDASLRSLTIPPWVASELRTAFDSAGDPTAGRPTLLAHTIALQMRVASDQARLRQALALRSQELYAVQAELMLDTAMGMALKREIQQAIDEEVRQGRMAPAKRWTSVKNDLNSAISSLQRLLADSERKRAESLSDKLTDEPRDEGGAPDRYAHLMQQFESEDRERKRLALAKKKAREALANLPSRTELLVASLAVTVAIWLGFVKLPEYFTAPAPLLSVTDFPQNDGFLQVEARPPSLYITMDGQVWFDLSEEERSHMVGTVSSVLLTEGYTGVLLKTAEGRPVAQWMAMTGVSLLEEDEIRRSAEDAAPPGPAAGNPVQQAPEARATAFP